VCASCANDLSLGGKGEVDQEQCSSPQPHVHQNLLHVQLEKSPASKAKIGMVWIFGSAVGVMFTHS
jgi:hypothetical protein